MFQALIAGRRRAGCAINKMGSEEGAQSYTVNTPGAPGHATGVPALQCQSVTGRASIAMGLVPQRQREN